MSILIKGMEMPQNCYSCPVRNQGYCGVGMKCSVTGETKSWHDGQFQRGERCPLVPVPPHGRLGDLDKLENGLRHMAKYQHGERQQGILGCCETIRLAPTIIPAEEGET